VRAIIFANGEVNGPIPIEAQSQPGDIIIAADGGSINCLKNGMMPDILIGDLDSLSQERVLSFESAGIKIIRFPERKDYTDLELAVQYAIGEEFQEILILGALGQRWDQTLANLLLLAAAPFTGANIKLIDGQQEMLERNCAEIERRPGEEIGRIGRVRIDHRIGRRPQERLGSA
jgi:thiamine pyrophosphokinase